MSSIGIRIPLTANDIDGFTMLKTIQQMVKQNFKMLILTLPGERVMDPTFGVGLHKYLFRNFSEAIGGTIKDDIIKKTKMYLPAITIDDIDIRSDPDKNKLKVMIKYRIPNIGVSDLMEITI